MLQAQGDYQQVSSPIQINQLTLYNTYKCTTLSVKRTVTEDDSHMVNVACDRLL